VGFYRIISAVSSGIIEALFTELNFSVDIPGNIGYTKYRFNKGDCKMATKRQFIKRCDELGVDYEINHCAGNVTIIIDSPAGLVFHASGSHCCCADGHDGNIPMAKLYDMLIDDMEGGLLACNDPSCDICETTE
jgi:hypothetical protein